MLWAILTHLTGFVVDLIVGTRRAGQAKDLEIALLRHQVRLLQRRASGPPLWWPKSISAARRGLFGRTPSWLSQYSGSDDRRASNGCTFRPTQLEASAASRGQSTRRFAANGYQEQHGERPILAG